MTTDEPRSLDEALDRAAEIYLDALDARDRQVAVAATGKEDDPSD